MTLDEAIKHAEEVAEDAKLISMMVGINHITELEQKKCANEHRQLAEWLLELKRLREAANDTDTIRRQMTIEKVYHLHGCTLIFKHDHNGIGLITVEVMDMLMEMVRNDDKRRSD